MSAVVSKFITKAAAEWAAEARQDADTVNSAVADVRELLAMARELCQWKLGDVEQGREAQSRLHLLLEAAQSKTEQLHYDTAALRDGLGDVRDQLTGLQEA